MCLYGVTENIWEVVCAYSYLEVVCAYSYSRIRFMHKHQLQLAGGCGNKSDVTRLPIIITCVLGNNKTIKQIRSTECG